MRVRGVSSLVCCLCVSLIGVSACSGTDGGSGEATPPEACRDLATALAEKAESCGDSYEENRASFIDSAANGDCDNIDEVRSRDELYGDCIPFWENMTCTEYENFTSSDIPDSCRGQLVLDQ